VGDKLKRRRGKPLVAKVFIAEDDERKQEFRCQVVREQPFRSTSNDVTQATNRCNVDYQFLACAPPLPEDTEDSNATQLAAGAASTKSHHGDVTQLADGTVANNATQPVARRRIRTKTRQGVTKATSQLRSNKPPWFPKSVNLSPKEQRCILSFAASFQKAAAMDFYITKYQGKSMESLTPLFKCLTQGIHRLECQEAEEKKAAEEQKKSALADGESVILKIANKSRQTMEDIAYRCRRLTIRLHSMANRCFWLSAAELLIHVFADGDCLQSHKNITIFTKQLQWACQQCKQILNKDIPEVRREQEFKNIETVTVHVASTSDRVSQPGGDGVAQPVQRENAEDDDDDEDDGSDHEDIVKIEASTNSTNASDDYAHRGPKLGNLPLYIYRMYVRRIPKPKPGTPVAPTVFFFELHYALSRQYAQEMVLHNEHVPTIDGFQCPTVEQDAEQNALCKAILFTPWACTNPMTCGHVLTQRGLLSDGNHPEGGAPQPAPLLSEQTDTSPPTCAYTFQRAWKLRSSEIHMLADRAHCRCLAARKRLVMADTILFADTKEPPALIEESEQVRHILVMLFLTRLRRTAPGHGVRIILAFMGLPCKWHPEQCTVAEFAAYISRDVVAHIDLAAEARVNKPRKQLQPDESDSEVEDESTGKKRPQIELVDMGGGDYDNIMDATEEVPLGEVSSFPLTDVSTTLSLCFQEADLDALDEKKGKANLM